MEECVEHVKKHGINRVMLDLSVVDKHGYNSLFTEDFTKKIKQIVEVFNLVESFGGLFQAKVALYKEGFTGGIECGDRLIEDDVLKQAIELVEKCK